jgi:Cu+-exporting ATPase
VPGLGVEAKIDGQEVLLGNLTFLTQRGMASEALIDQQDRLSHEGKTAIFLAVAGLPVGVIAAADTLKPRANQTVDALKQMGLKILLLSGDNQKTATTVAESIGIEEVLAEVLPGDKAQKVTDLQAAGEVVAMVGDGINDAPALAAADVGIALGTGADVALEAADLTLIRDDLDLIPQAIKLSRRMMRIIRQNLFWALCYNIIAIPVAAGAFYPLWGWTLNPALAAAAMAMSSVSVVTNSLRLRRFKG